MKKIAIIAGYSKSIINFRGDLIKNWIRMGYEVYAIGPENECREEILLLGVKDFYSIKVNRTGINLFSDLRYLLTLRKLLVKIAPDVTLGYTIKPAIYGAIAAKMARVKNINSMITGAGFLFVSDSLKARILKKLSFLLFKLGFKCANNVIFQNTDDLQEFVLGKLVKKEKCSLVNGSGVNMTKFFPAAFPDKITFLMMARLLYAKGTMEFLEAARRIKEKYPDVRFLMIGQSENKADCINPQDAIFYLKSGIVENIQHTNEVPKYLAQCSVYVLPSYREGVPRSVLEAMAMARPIITTNAPGCRETVIDGVNGFLIPIKNVDALVEKMEWFILNQDKIQNMGIRSLDVCKEQFEVSKVNNTMNVIMGI